MILLSLRTRQLGTTNNITVEGREKEQQHDYALLLAPVYYYRRAVHVWGTRDCHPNAVETFGTGMDPFAFASSSAVNIMVRFSTQYCIFEFHKRIAPSRAFGPAGLFCFSLCCWPGVRWLGTTSSLACSCAFQLLPADGLARSLLRFPVYSASPLLLQCYCTYLLATKGPKGQSSTIGR